MLLLVAVTMPFFRFSTRKAIFPTIGLTFVVCIWEKACVVVREVVAWARVGILYSF